MELLVSVVMPSFNRAHSIERAMKSVLHQTYKNWELLVIDDASTDHTQAIVGVFAQHDSRIKYHRMEQNGGACVARNKGIQLAKGTYITFLDSDDEYLPEKIELQVKCFQESDLPNVGAVSCGREDFRNGVKYFEWIPKLRGNIVNNLLQKDRIGAGTPFLMTRRDILVKHDILFDPQFPSSEEWDLLLRICQHSAFDFVPQPLVRVYHHDGERLYTNDRALIAVEKQYSKYKHLLVQDKKIHDKFVLKMAVQHYVYGKSDHAVRILQNRMLDKSMRASLWQGCMKAFPRYGSISSKIVHKVLESISFN